ncbi:MAG: PhzF family phenazine biosynthesis protein [Lysobacterales bacterium]|jgi:predicted PhzF superfamily epimerase YddE/YHI9
MKLRQYQVDAFASRVFEGNPAAVCPLEHWLPDETLQAIAAENNLSETAFFVAKKGQAPFFELRWFTPAAEVNLCGHATLASAHVLYEILSYGEPEIRFATRSGELRVRREGDRLAMDFPARPPATCEPPPGLASALGAEPSECLASDDYLFVFPRQADVLDLRPDFGKIAALGLRGAIVTAPGESHDFVSRFFAPNVGVPEDPVTGSAHCVLAPYWAARLGKTRLQARQVSKRGGDVLCEVRGERVLLAGHAVTFMTGNIEIPD